MRIGVDLGGTKIEAIVLGDTGEIVHRRRVATPTGSYEKTLRAVVNLVQGIESELEIHGSVGIGTPGAISPATGTIKNANSTHLIGHPLDQDLSAALGREVRISNDANCFALSEAVDGAGVGAEVVFGVIIGTGTGGGIVVRGAVLTGPNAIAGEWGHNPLPWPTAEELPGPDCYCGKKGCIETFVSGPGLARDFHLATGKSLEPPGNNRPNGTWRWFRGGRPETLRRPFGTRSCPYHQYPGPGRDRVGWRHGQRDAALHERPSTLGQVRLF